MESIRSLDTVIEQVSRDKGIDPKILIETMEQAILTAAKRTFGLSRELEARYNKESGAVDLFQYMTIVEQVDSPEREIAVEDARKHGFDAELGEELGFQVFYLQDDMDKAATQDKEFGDLLQLQQHRNAFGRIAAQTAKQVIIQRVRDAERDLIFNEFKDRKGELITGVVRRFERGSNIVVDLGRTEALLPSREQAPRESYRPGDRIVAFLKEIDREARGPQIILSRTDVGLLIKLFEMEVPEIYEGIVRIVAAAREPGARSKIAVSSRDSDVDPVGACVGMKGSRVQAVVQELRGEKIDIVPWDRDPARFVCNAIAPAEVARVVVDETNGSMELVVPDDKLSLAIGRRGQNVRLASQLTGWKLDIVSEDKFKRIEEQALSQMGMIEGVGDDFARSLYKYGFRGLGEVLEASLQELSSVPGFDPETYDDFRSRVQDAKERFRAQQLKSAAESEAEPSGAERLMLIQGMNQRISSVLTQQGFREPEDIAKEKDVDRFSIKTGLDSKKAQEIREAAQRFLSEEWPKIKEQRAELASKRQSQAQEKSQAAAPEANPAPAAEEAESAEAAAPAEAQAQPEQTPAKEEAPAQAESSSVTHEDQGGVHGQS